MPSSSAEWREIDWLRGMACALMVLNHAGVAWLVDQPQRDLGTDFVVQLGSYAPVLFYFVTGLGYGVRAPAVGQPVRRQTVSKILVLLLADQFLLWNHASLALGINFLAFIGLSAALLEWITRREKAEAWAWGLLLAAVTLRFGLGSQPAFELLAVGPDSPLHQIVGRTSIPHCSYPVGPWLTYPLAGYLIGRRASALRSAQPSARTVLWARWGWAVVALCTLMTVVMLSRGMPYFRWGTMSLAFFVSSFALLGLSLAAAHGLARSGGRGLLATSLSIRGITSLAFVPAHYVVIELVLAAARSLTGANTFASATYLLLVVPMSMVVLMLSRQAAATLERIGGAATGFVAILPWALCASAAYLLLAIPEFGGLARVLAMAVGQLATCLWLVRTKPAATTPA